MGNCNQSGRNFPVKKQRLSEGFLRKAKQKDKETETKKYISFFFQETHLKNKDLEKLKGQKIYSRKILTQRNNTPLLLLVGEKKLYRKLLSHYLLINASLEDKTFKFAPKT